MRVSYEVCLESKIYGLCCKFAIEVIVSYSNKDKFP